jgi:sRNA-binding carbon storage regulator CsrA
MSRHEGEAIMIGSDVLVTVVAIVSHSVRLRVDVKLFDKTIKHNVTLRPGESYSVLPGAEVSLVDLRVDKARLGVTAPKETCVERFESRNVSHTQHITTLRSTIIIKPDQTLHIGDKLTAALTDIDTDGVRLMIRGELLGGPDDGAWVYEPRELALHNTMSLGTLVTLMLVSTNTQQAMLHVIAPPGMSVRVE